MRKFNFVYVFTHNNNKINTYSFEKIKNGLVIHKLSNFIKYGPTIWSPVQVTQTHTDRFFS